MDTKRCSVLVIGATGATGTHLVNQLLQCPEITSVSTIARRPLKLAGDTTKLHEYTSSDFAKLNELDVKEECDIGFCCLGTTRADAGSDEAFRLVDLHYVIAFAKLCQKVGVKDLHVLSSVGADSSSWFLYPQTKGEMEVTCFKMGFKHCVAYRAPLLDRGDAARTAEKVGSVFMTTMKVEDCATIMLKNAVAIFNDGSASATSILENKDMVKILKANKPKK